MIWELLRFVFYKNSEMKDNLIINCKKSEQVFISVRKKKQDRNFCSKVHWTVRQRKILYREEKKMSEVAGPEKDLV